jgi:hypothetical protein
MITVILIWLYVLVTTYLTGFFLLNAFTSITAMANPKAKGQTKKYSIHFQESYIVAGIVATTVFAQIVSLFSGVGLGANAVLVLADIVVAIFFREELKENFFGMVHMLRAKKDWIWYMLVFLLMAYGTSHGIMHYDSDLYHAQAIRWIEEYGVLKGLGNIHVRLAYNSASFALSALYSFAFLGKQSFHVMAGFFALLLAWQCLDIKTIVRRGYIVLSDFARVAAMYYLFTIYDEIVAPASDYFLSTIVFYIIICWLDLYVRHVKSYVPYILLALLGIYAVTIKLSAAPMVLLSAIPIVKLFHNRTEEKMKAFGVAVITALLITIPFFVRNVIISGWILYPVTFLNFFNCAWKIPKGIAQYDSVEIKTFGRGYNDVEAYMNTPFYEWVPNWFSNLGTFNKLMVIAALIAALLYIAYVIYFVVVVFVRKQNISKLSKTKVFDISHRSMLNFADFLTLSGTLILCLLFWFMSAPLIRYGIVYVLATISMVYGRVIILILNRIDDSKKKVIIRAFIAILSLWLIYKGANVVLEDVPRFNAKYLAGQQDYGVYETGTFKLGDTTFYYPLEGDKVGYAPFPSATHDLTGEVDLMGGNLTNGIKNIIKQ